MVLKEKATYKLRGTFFSKSWEPDFLTQLDYAEFDEPGSQAELLVFYVLISVHKMADKG